MADFVALHIEASLEDQDEKSAVRYSALSARTEYIGHAYNKYIKKRLSKRQKEKRTSKRRSGKGGCKEKMLEATSLSSYVRINVE